MDASESSESSSLPFPLKTSPSSISPPANLGFLSGRKHTRTRPPNLQANVIEIRAFLGGGVTGVAYVGSFGAETIVVKFVQHNNFSQNGDCDPSPLELLEHEADIYRILPSGLCGIAVPKFYGLFGGDGHHAIIMSYQGTRTEQDLDLAVVADHISPIG